jgi:hypothetical protein
LLLSSCRNGWPGCVEPRGIEGAGLTISFINAANNEYFYLEFPLAYPSIYKLDSLRVKDSNGNILTTPSQINQDPINGLKRFYVVAIYPIFIPGDDDAAYINEQSKTIFIKYNHNIYDTIKLVYKAARERCANKYEYLKAYYRGNLIAESYNSYSDNLRFKLKH